MVSLYPLYPYIKQLRINNSAAIIRGNESKSIGNYERER